MENLTTIQLVCIWLLPVIFAITFHEVMHGYVAKWLGDKTAMLLGRLSFNPLKHIDVVGTVIVPLLTLFLTRMVFGWAKPVPITSKNFRHPKRDMILVSIAGPTANLVSAIAWALIGRGGLFLIDHNVGWALAVLYMGQAGIMINVVLCVLNLLPIPPLDGWHIWAALLPRKITFFFERVSLGGLFLLLIFLLSGMLGKIISIPVGYLLQIITKIFGI